MTIGENYIYYVRVPGRPSTASRRHYYRADALEEAEKYIAGGHSGVSIDEVPMAGFGDGVYE